MNESLPFIQFPTSFSNFLQIDSYQLVLIVTFLPVVAIDNFIEESVILECDENFDLRCALTAYKEKANSVPNSADAKNLIGSELWLFSNKGKQQTVRSRESGEVTVMNYVDGKCNVRKVDKDKKFE